MGGKKKKKKIKMGSRPLGKELGFRLYWNRASTPLFTKCTKSKYQEGHHYHRPFTSGYKIFLKTLWSLLLTHGKWEYLHDQSVGVVHGFQNIPQTPKPSLTLGYVNIHRPSIFFECSYGY
jgi:hypothetical protein